MFTQHAAGTADPNAGSGFMLKRVTRFGAVAAALAVFALDALAASPSPLPSPIPSTKAVQPLLSAGDHAGFVGTAECATCHEGAAEQWTDSHHDLAMQQVTPDTVLGDFDNASFEYFGELTEFYRRDGAYFVRTAGPSGERQEFPVTWTFGVYPLQQYLLPLEDGRLQALSIAWDSRPAAQGGQRWYHLHPEEPVRAGDPLHWTGPYYNWNTRCAECHSTDLQKNYRARERRYETTFFEEDVGCEGCHGPGQKHIESVNAGTLNDEPRAGFPTQLKARGDWYFPPGETIARRREPLGTATQVDREQITSCARCHARRSTLGAYTHGKPFSDTHRLSLLDAPLYYPDGQIRDEVYVYGSFLQSKMQQAGVVCSNCHEPHSNKLRASGNAVCAQCHAPSRFDTPKHHHHGAVASATAGSAANAATQCVSCHMPATTYMGVDDRRDHSMRVPRPDLSVTIGTPNACNSCHTSESPEWAADALQNWGVSFNAEHPALALAALQQGDSRRAAELGKLAADRSASPIWRATALEHAANAGDPNTLNLARRLLQSSDPLLRVSAVRALERLPLPQRYRSLAPLMGDPVTGVRMEVASALASVPLQELGDAERSALLQLLNEYKTVQLKHAEMPATQLQLGIFHSSRKDAPAAENAYREALSLNPELIPARLNLADLLRSQGRETEARSMLEQAVAIAPQSGAAKHALGLLEARSGNRAEALAMLGAAAETEVSGARHRFVYAVALHDFGERDKAIEELKKLHSALPGDEQALLALSNYTAEAGDRASARQYAQSLLALAPGNPAYRQLAQRLGVNN